MRGNQLQISKRRGWGLKTYASYASTTLLARVFQVTSPNFSAICESESTKALHRCDPSSQHVAATIAYFLEVM